MHETVEKLLSERPVLLDGAWATELYKAGLKYGDAPETFNLKKPGQVESIAQAYVEAGSRIILTNTFGGTAYRLAPYGLANRVKEVNRIGTECSKRAAGEQARVFASIGPTGKTAASGTATELELFTAFSMQAKALAAGGADGIVIETMYDLTEAKIALKAAQETGLPTCVSMVYDARSNMERTCLGTTVEQAVEELTEAGADIIGSNCGQGIEGFVKLTEKMKKHTHLPIWIKANAGLPERMNGIAVYTTTADDFASFAPPLLDAGADFIGGCCGTSPDFIRALKTAL